MYINKKAIKEFYHNHNKRVKLEAIEELNRKVEKILLNSLNLTKNFKTITAIEIIYSSSK